MTKCNKRLCWRKATHEVGIKLEGTSPDFCNKHYEKWRAAITKAAIEKELAQ